MRNVAGDQVFIQVGLLSESRRAPCQFGVWALERPLSRVGPQVVQEVVQLDERLLASLDVALEQRLLTGRSWVAVFEDSERSARR